MSNIQRFFTYIIFFGLVFLVSCSKDDSKKEEKDTFPRKVQDVRRSEGSFQDVKTNSSSPIISPKDMTLGKKDSKVTMIVYLSPSCYGCALFHKHIFPTIKSKYIDTQKILYVSREIITSKQDFYACILARCQNTTESYFKYLNIIFKNQSSWAYRKNYYSVLSNIGIIGNISQEEYDHCLASEELKHFIISNRYEALKKYNVNYTPIIVINGEMVKGELDAISSKIDSILSKK